MLASEYDDVDAVAGTVGFHVYCLSIALLTLHLGSGVPTVI